MIRTPFTYLAITNSNNNHQSSNKKRYKNRIMQNTLNQNNIFILFILFLRGYFVCDSELCGNKTIRQEWEKNDQQKKQVIIDECFRFGCVLYVYFRDWDNQGQHSIVNKRAILFSSSFFYFVMLYVFHFKSFFEKNFQINFNTSKQGHHHHFAISIEFFFSIFFFHFVCSRFWLNTNK